MKSRESDDMTLKQAYDHITNHLREFDDCTSRALEVLLEYADDRLGLEASRGEEICNWCKHGPVTTGASSCLILSCYGYSKFDPVANTPPGIRNKAEDIQDSLIW